MARRKKDDAAQREAWAAVIEFRKLVPTLEVYARSMTGNPKIQILLTHSVPRTDGKSIWLKPPRDLGKSRTHKRSRCGMRGPDLRLACKACDQRELLMGQLYHEISHIVFKSTDRPLPGMMKRNLEFVKRYHPDDVCAHAKLYENPVSYPELTLWDPILRLMYGFLDDARVNAAMMRARPGTADMIGAMVHEAMNEGSLDDDGQSVGWDKAPIDQQVLVAVFLLASEFPFSEDFLHPKAWEIARMDELDGIIRSASYSTNVHEAYMAAQNMLEILIALEILEPQACKKDEEGDGDPVFENGPGASGEAGAGGDPSDGESGEPGGSGGTVVAHSPGSHGTPDSGGSASSDSKDPGGADKEDEADSSGGGSGKDNEEDEAAPQTATGGKPDDDSDNELPAPDATGASGRDSGDDSGDGEDEGGSEDPLPNAGQDGSVPDDSDVPEELEGAGGAGEGDEEEDEDLDDIEDPDKDKKHLEHKDVDDEIGEYNEDDDEADDFDDDEWREPEGRSSSPGELVEALKKFNIHRYLDDDEIDKMLGVIGDNGEMMNPDDDDLNKASEGDTEYDRLLKDALSQAEHFDRQAYGIGSMRIFEFPDRDIGWLPGSPERFQADEVVLGHSVMKARLLFEKNKKTGYTGDRKSGRIESRKLAKRAPFSDPRMFKKAIKPDDLDYEVCIGIDASGSASGPRIAKMIACVMAQAEVLNRVGVPFSIYAHSGGQAEGSSWNSDLLDVWMLPVKTIEQPWDVAARERLAGLGALQANLDGHSLEFYRKVLDMSRAKVKILNYYSDGAMPCENYDEERRLLKDEIEMCKRKGYHLTAVGIDTDAPRQHGFETVVVGSARDIPLVIDQLEKQITGG